MRHHVPLATVLLLSACGAKKSDDHKAPTPASGGQTAALSVEYADLTASELTQGTAQSIRTQGAWGKDRAFRFSLPSSGKLALTEVNKHWSCDQDPEIRVSVQALLPDRTLSPQVTGAPLPDDGSLDLAAGDYAVVVRAHANIVCSDISLGLTLRVTPIPTPSEPSSGGNRAPDAEQNRILKHELKDEAALEFYAYASAQEKCVPILKRTMADVKRSMGNLALPGTAVKLTRVDARDQHDTQFEFHTLSQLGFQKAVLLDFIRQSTYPQGYADELQNTLLRESGTAKVSLDFNCDKEGAYWATHMAAFGDLPLWSSSLGSDLPLSTAANSFPDVTFTYGNVPGQESLLIQGSVDTKGILDDLPHGASLSDVAKVQWMLGHKSSDFEYPLSDWQDVDPESFLGGRFRIDLKELAARGVFHFYSAAIAFRVIPKGEHATAHTYVLDVGNYCQDAYTERSDAALYHASLFHSLTNPEWQGTPSKADHTGCLFIGQQVRENH